MNDAVKKEVYSTFTLGDMYIRYILEEKGQMDLQIVPLSKKDDIVELKESRGDCLVQAKLIGDVYASGYSGGVTMRNNGTTDNMKFVKQEINETVSKIKSGAEQTEIITYFDDGKNHQYIHTLGFTEGDFALDSKTTFVNSSSETAVLEMLSSFSLGEITPFEKDDAQEMLLLHRIRSKWSEEGYLVTETAEDLQLEPSWAYWPPNSIRYGQVGSMPVKSFAPFGAVEDKKANVIWAAQLAVESSWQMEFYRRDNSMYFSGGIADREFGHWYKNILSGESFTTPTAILTATTEDIDTACQRLTSYQKKFLNGNPQCEQHLPIMFNEYCTTWGNPSEENIERILKAISGHGMEYFVVDCGWFLEDGKDWSNSMGDYVPNKRLFPNGLISVSKKIHDAGM
ncbi:MAG: alpha-galactosidase, partial [Treponemataceae bacterium]|nr:alpha-galactosidase [Treponemataceae bacterium]